MHERSAAPTSNAQLDVVDGSPLDLEQAVIPLRPLVVLRSGHVQSPWAK